MMKSLAVVAIGALTALLAGAALASGAHNPTTVDHPDIPNCTLAGNVTYENTPSCETVIYTGSTSLVGNTGTFKPKYVPPTP